MSPIPGKGHDSTPRELTLKGGAKVRVKVPGLPEPARPRGSEERGAEEPSPGDPRPPGPPQGPAAP